MPTIVERDWIQELEERKVITSAEMQCFVQRMGAKTRFNAPELAGVLATSVNTVYGLGQDRLHQPRRGTEAVLRLPEGERDEVSAGPLQPGLSDYERLDNIRGAGRRELDEGAARRRGLEGRHA